MRRPLIGLALAAVLVPLRADEASKIAKVEEFLTLSKMEQQMARTLEIIGGSSFRNSIQGLVAGRPPAPELQEELREFEKQVLGVMAESFSWEKLKPGYVKLYADAFTEEELDGLVAFYRSPAGKAMVDKSPQIAEQGQRIAIERLQTIQPRIRELSEEFRARVTKKVTEAQK